MSDQDECSSRAPRAHLKLFRCMAKGKLYTSGNSHVISTVREQTVEQRASKLAQRDTSLRLELQWSRTCKNPPRNGNSTHDCPRLQGLCGGYSQILRMSLNHILQDSYWTQTELYMATVKRGFYFYNSACGTKERSQSKTKRKCSDCWASWAGGRRSTLEPNP